MYFIQYILYNVLYVLVYPHTVSVVFSKRCPSRHHVITAGGLDPALWHSRSYLLPADNGWCAPSNRIFNGVTVTWTNKEEKKRIKYTEKRFSTSAYEKQVKGKERVGEVITKIQQ